ncbi:hypothetical protein DZF83_16895 [Vibrio parahaemolyticus]|nr:hypothetical protein [Vibrio parahaemolyticus]
MGLVFILRTELPTAHWITARIWYELGERVGLVESDGTTVDDDGKLDGKPKLEIYIRVRVQLGIHLKSQLKTG